MRGFWLVCGKYTPSIETNLKTNMSLVLHLKFLPSGYYSSAYQVNPPPQHFWVVSQS